MKCLHHKFVEELADESNFFVKDGYLYIRSRYWSAEDILEVFSKRDGNNAVFDEIFMDWFESRRLEKLGEANEILDKFDQKDRFIKLTEAFKNGSLIPFVGAGMSVQSGYPGWTKFLKQKRQQTLIPEQDLENKINEGLYEEAAQQLADAMGPAAFSEAVDATFGCTRELSGPVEMLPYLFTESVVTTNFDNVLERSYSNANIAFPEKLSGCESQEIRRKLASNERFLLMLHGKATSGQGRILTKNEYDNHYVNGQTLAKTIQALCNSKSLLFLGCSLTIDRVLSEIKQHVNSEGHEHLPKHYTFLEEPQSNEERIQRQSLLAELHIYPIWYPAGTHDESIEALLMKLWDATT